MPCGSTWRWKRNRWGWTVRSKTLLWLGLGGVLAIGTPLAAQVPRLISTAELAALGDSSPVRVIDVRQSWVSYLQNHIPNAAWLNVETLLLCAQVPARLSAGADLHRFVDAVVGAGGAAGGAVRSKK